MNKIVGKRAHFKTGVSRKKRRAKFLRKTKISFPLIRTRTYSYQGVRNVHFSENLVCMFSSNTRFEIRPFTLLLDLRHERVKEIHYQFKWMSSVKSQYLPSNQIEHILSQLMSIFIV